MLEIACFNLTSALVAPNAGADRIELCNGADVGGTTPDFESLFSIRSKLSVPVFIMIRPRGGGFVYSDAEFTQMKTDIERFKPLASGFVFGILTTDQEVDIPKVYELVSLAHPLPCTFHRAFDEAKDLSEALEDIIRCGCRYVLTSGGASNAIAGIGMLEEVVRQADWRIGIMVGGGVRSSNIKTLKEKTNAVFFHSSALMMNDSVASVDEIRTLKQLLVE